MNDKLIVVVVGDANEAVRVAPFLLACGQSGADFSCLLLSAGPQRDEASAQLQEFEISPAEEVVYEGTDIYPCELAGRGLTRLGAVISAKKPDLVLIAGESDAALAAAMASFHLRISVAYINESAPPSGAKEAQEQARRRDVLLRLAAVCTVPRARMRLSLTRDGIPAEGIVVTGTSMVDAISDLGNKWVYGLRSPAKETGADGAGQLLVLALPPTGIEDVVVADYCLALRDLAEARPRLRAVIPLLPFAASRKVAGRVLAGGQRVVVADTSSLSDRVQLWRRATLVLSSWKQADIEAVALGVPSLELPDGSCRKKPSSTEHSEDTSVLGNRARIVSRVTHLLDDPVALQVLARQENPYGDGNSGERLVRALANYLAGKTILLNPGDEFLCGPKQREPRDWQEAEALLPAPEMLFS